MKELASSIDGEARSDVPEDGFSGTAGGEGVLNNVRRAAGRTDGFV